MSYLDEAARKQMEELLTTDPVLIDYMTPKDTSEIHIKTILYGIPFIASNQMLCLSCGKSVIGDPKYHQVYEKGLLIGYKHRRCII